ncbi:MAG: FAD-dependent oxidoreductase [Lentisphaeria bacterium]|jgi:NADPH-dependent 2,4-dienoyl-CoA reductase/sulfur reductase-like enzyme/peroxiredoxin family protein/rhodanese-related sulfurtransferase/TusA-related sulfurtransferase
MKVIIVGGVAAGAGAAARLRRLDEKAEIILIERGEYISYANCGLPYHLGGVIPKRESLILNTTEKFIGRFNITIRTNSEVTAIDPQAHKVTIRGKDGALSEESYDKLVLATGSSPIMAPIPGIDDPRVMRLWTIPDMDAINQRIKDGAKRAVVVGAGFIGLETAENLLERGLDVTIVELLDQLLPCVDKEMSTPLAQELSRQGIALRLGKKVVAIDKQGADLAVVLDDNEKLPADLVVMSIGVKPNSELAKAAGLETGPRGHILVNELLQTSNPDIYAAGDAIEVLDPITGGKTAVPLAGPANKQARIVADNIVGRQSRYRGSYGTSIIKIGSLAAASVGITERRIKQLGLDYHKIYLHPASSSSYYPGSSRLSMKLLFAPDGKILGAQIVGKAGVDKRIDVIATAMACGMTAPDLATLELSYAPPFNSAKDPVNFAGMVAGNVLNGDSRLAYMDDLPADANIIDVRESAEYELGAIPNSINIPLATLRSRLGELDKSKPYIVSCQSSLRSYLAERIMRQHGFTVRNLTGSYLTWQLFHPEPFVPAKRQDKTATPTSGAATPPVLPPTGAAPVAVLDVRALACPGPVVELKTKIDAIKPGESVSLLAPLSFTPDLQGWIKSTGHELVSLNETPQHLEAVVRKAGGAAPAADSNKPAAAAAGHGAAIVLFSNDLDKAMAALIIACGMAAAGAKTGIFFTFWGLSVLRKEQAPPKKKSFMSQLFGWMLPRGANHLPLSKMNMGGMGATMMKKAMAEKNVTTLPKLIRQARELGVKFIACEMAMDVMGITRDELIEVDEVAGVASFVEMAKNSNNTLFI